MRRMIVLSGMAAALVVGLASSRAAADDRATCMSRPTTEASVPACTRVIEAGGKNLPLVYAWRCYHNRMRGDYDRSLEDANIAIRLESRSAPSFLCRGATEFRMRDYDGAIRDATEVIRFDAANEEAYLLRGNSHYQKENYESAIVDMTEAIRLRPEDARPYLFRGESYYRQERYADALADGENAIRLDPTSDIAYDLRSHVYFGWGDDEKAIADATEAIRLKPRSGGFYNFRGFLYRHTGDVDRAISDLNQANVLDPALAAPYANRGEIHRQKGELDRAIVELTKALLLDGSNTPAFTRRGMAFEQGGDLARARADYNEVLAQPPSRFVSAKWAVDTARRRLSALAGMPVEAAANASPAPPRIGGLAVGTCDRVGSATGFDSLDVARSRILEACGPKNCRIVVPVSGNCAAFAIEGSCGPRGWAAGADRRQAEEAALRQCRESGGSNCSVRRSICDGPG